MGSYSEIEKLFREVLDEKDRFKISASAELIRAKLKEAQFKEQCLEAKEDHLETTQSLLDIYSITFNQIMWKKIRQQMEKILDCIDAPGN